MSEATLRENLDKMHRWTFGTEGEFGKGVAREMVQQVSDALAAQAVSLPDRDALAKILDDNSIELRAEEYGTGMFFSMDPAEIADAVLAALSTQPAAGEVEWEYGWNTGSTFMVIGSREDAERWLDSFGAKPGVGDWGSRLRRRRRAPEPDTWTEVPTMPTPELAELFPGTLAALDHLSIRPEVQ